MHLDNIKHIGIIGTGMIGTSMAVMLTGNGYKTTLFAVNDELQQKSIELYDSFYKDLIEKKLVTPAQAEACREYLSYTQEYDGIADCEVVFECVFENVEAKHGVYKDIEANCTNVQAIVSTTSALSAEDLVGGLDKYKGKMVVAHPFNPPHLVPYVELVKSPVTEEGVPKLVYDLLESAGRKVVVLKKSAPGFIANRLQHALFREAINIVERGIADPEDVDKAAMYSFMPRYTKIGIFEHLDNSGVDLNYDIENYLFPDLSDAKSAPKMICDLMEKKEYGVKSGKGVYDWSKKDMDDFRERTSAPYIQFFNWDLPEGR